MKTDEEIWDGVFAESVNMVALDAVEQFLEACFVKNGYDDLMDEFRDRLAVVWLDQPQYPSWDSPLDVRSQFDEEMDEYYRQANVIDDMTSDIKSQEDVQRAFALSVVERAFELLAMRSYIELSG